MAKLKVIKLFKGDSELVLVIETRSNWVRAAVHATESTATAKFGVDITGPLKQVLSKAESEGWIDW